MTRNYQNPPVDDFPFDHSTPPPPTGPSSADYEREFWDDDRSRRAPLRSVEDLDYDEPHAPGHGSDEAETDLDAPSQYDVPDVDDLLDEAIEIIAATKPLPMSTTVKVNREDLLDILEAAREQLPEELRAARWLLKEREEFLARARQERDEIINEGRIQVARLIERQEIVRAADTKARQIVEEARAEARDMQRQVEDYCDQKLASFEVVLSRTAQTIQQGREKLLGAARVDDDMMSRHPLDDPADRPSSRS